MAVWLNNNGFKIVVTLSLFHALGLAGSAKSWKLGDRRRMSRRRAIRPFDWFTGARGMIEQFRVLFRRPHGV
jgi:hypothetical protein